MPKTWHEKLNDGREPLVEVTDKAFAGIPAGVKMVIPTPKVVKELIEQIPSGKTLSVHDLRKEIARLFSADVTCPLTTGIFLRIVAEAAMDEHRAGKSWDEVTPFWRVLDAKSKAAAKLSCGPQFLTEMRQRETN